MKMTQNESLLFQAGSKFVFPVRQTGMLSCPIRRLAGKILSLAIPVLVLILLSVSLHAKLIYPGNVMISSFDTDKAIYQTGKPVVFSVAFTAGDNHESDADKELDIQIWVEREMEKPFLATSKKVKAAGGSQVEKLEWLWADKNVFGHRAWVRFIDPEGRMLAEQDTFFDIADKWVDVMRLVSMGAKNIAGPDYPDNKIQEQIAAMKAGYFNALEMFTFSPVPYELAPKENEWLYQYQKPDSKVMVSKERLQTWGNELHRNGMRYVAYNETSAAKGPEDWQVYQKYDDFKKPYAHYFEDKGMFTPNSIKIADHFATDLAESIKVFRWDGILMDSAMACHINTAEGYDAGGKNKLTELSAGEVGYIYLEKAKKLAREINPEFSFLSQNATSISHNSPKLDVDKIYPWICANAERLKVRKYCELVDLWTLEIDAHNEPRDGRYPLTYEKMSVVLNSIIEVTERPLMCWALLVPPYYKEYSVAFVRPYLALLFASRTKVHDHFDAYGGAWSEGRVSPVSRQVIKYNRFMARFSYFLWDPQLRWVLNPQGEIGVSGPRPIFWDRLVYRRQLPDGRTRTVINLLNLPSNGSILDQEEIPPIAQNVEISLSKLIKPESVCFVDADDDSLRPLTLVQSSVDNGGTSTYRIPPFACWGLVVIDGNAKLGQEK